MKILIIDDEKSVRLTTAAAAQAQGHETAAVDNGAAALDKLRDDQYDLVLLDLRLGQESGLEVLEEIGRRYPRVPVVVFTAYATVETAVDSMRCGAFDYLEKPFTPEQLKRVVLRVQEMRRLSLRITELEHEVAERAPENDFESDDEGARAAYSALFRAAETSAPVLIRGGSGTGKSVLAHEMHRRSPLQSRPFISVNCAQPGAGGLESVLFGRTGSPVPSGEEESWGSIVAAHGGTLFLDEMGELPPEIQPRILRLLKDKKYERTGEQRSRSVDARILMTTNRDLSAAVRSGQLRQDLFECLNIMSVELPALRQRTVDIPRLARKFLAFFSGQLGRAVSGYTPDALNCLQRYAWPGNLRELRNVVERAVMLARGERIGLEDLPEPLRKSTPADPMPGAMVTLDELERQHITKVLETAESMEAAARTLGIDPATLYRKRKRMQAG